MHDKIGEKYRRNRLVIMAELSESENCIGNNDLVYIQFDRAGIVPNVGIKWFVHYQIVRNFRILLKYLSYK